jgi:hypothetical protein
MRQACWPVPPSSRPELSGCEWGGATNAVLRYLSAGGYSIELVRDCGRKAPQFLEVALNDRLRNTTTRELVAGQPIMPRPWQHLAPGAHPTLMHLLMCVTYSIVAPHLSSVLLLFFRVSVMPRCGIRQGIFPGGRLARRAAPAACPYLDEQYMLQPRSRGFRIALASTPLKAGPMPPRERATAACGARCSRPSALHTRVSVYPAVAGYRARPLRSRTFAEPEPHERCAHG